MADFYTNGDWDEVSSWNTRKFRTRYMYLKHHIQMVNKQG